MIYQPDFPNRKKGFVFIEWTYQKNGTSLSFVKGFKVNLTILTKVS